MGSTSGTSGTDGEADVERPAVPRGRHLWLDGRGRTFVRELAGPAGAPTLVLLHGWTATADLNWWTSYGPLAEHFHVVAIDHRGHGRGLRSPEPFRLEQCADDVAALAAALGRNRIVPVGYSMGGPIAQLVWRRHRDLVDGLVLCATSATFQGTSRERWLERRRHRHERPRRRLAARAADERRARQVDRPARPAGVRLVGLRGGRPARLGADPGGRARGAALRLPPVGRRHRRADVGRRDRRRRGRADLSPAGARRRDPRRHRVVGARRARRVHDVARALRAAPARGVPPGSGRVTPPRARSPPPDATRGVAVGYDVPHLLVDAVSPGGWGMRVSSRRRARS